MMSSELCDELTKTGKKHCMLFKEKQEVTRWLLLHTFVTFLRAPYNYECSVIILYIDR